MSELSKECPARGGRAELNDDVSLVGINNQDIKQKTGVTQANNLPANVLIANRELLRDYAHEAAIQAAD